MIVTAIGTPSGPTSIYCPNGVSKVYVFVNKTLQPVTFSTVSGTGVTVSAGNSAFLYCDGTNVNACTIPTYTPNRAVVTNGSGYAQASSVTSTQIGYLSDVTSNIGAGKQNTISVASPGGILASNGSSAGSVILANLVGLNWNGTTNTLSVTGTAGVTSLTAASPMTANGFSGSPQTSNVTVAMTQANTSTSGWLSSTDWNNFSNKVGSIAQGTGISVSSTGGAYTVSNTGVVATDTTGVGTARYGPAAAGYGSDKAIFGYGTTGTSTAITNLVSSAGVVATDTTGVGTARAYLAAAGYGKIGRAHV